MEFMQLEMFIAAVEEGTIRGASTRVYRSQPAVSMAIRKIENEVGTPLFVHGNRGRLLTEAGALLYDFARRLIDLRRQALAALEEARSHPFK